MYKYNRPPMVLKCLPYFAQEVMENIFRHLEDTDIYIDDVGSFSTSWTSHIKRIDEVLGVLKDNGFTVNQFKCDWEV